MYEGNSLAQQQIGGGIGRAVNATVGTENAVDINSETMKMLHETASQLDHLIFKVEGPRPIDTTNKVQEPPPRGILNDARLLRGLASSLLNRASYLHDLIGNV